MLCQAGRRMVKRTLSFARVKLLYSRVTLTRFTTLYFFSAIIACIVLSALQAVTFADNSTANAALAPLVQNVSMATVTILDHTGLQICTSIPNQAGTICMTRLDFARSLKTRRSFESSMWIRHVEDSPTALEELGEDVAAVDENLVGFDSTSNVDIPKLSTKHASRLSNTCVLSLAWIAEMIQDAQREDVVTLLFQFWLFSLAFVAILNESIPHLGAAFFGHVLGTVWAGYRVQSTRSMMNLYRDEVVPRACHGVDVMGSLWDVRMQHAIPIVVINSLTLVAFSYLSAKLYRVYANESFSRVGASPMIHRIYKIILLFSVCLQLSGFFSLASAAMWIDKICHGTMKELANHWALYLSAFIVVFLFQFPWLYIGWVCVRRECRRRFAVFCGISGFLLVISTLMFFSPLYRYIFLNWPFFATVTVTAYILSVATSVLGALCRLNFGKGLAHYLQVTDALEGVDFTPVSFSKGYDSDAEKVDFQGLKASPTRTPPTPIILQLPALSFQEPKKQPRRGSSIYYESDGVPLKLSSSPPLLSDLGPAPKPRRSILKSPKTPSEKRSTYASSNRGSKYYDWQFKLESESHPVPHIKHKFGSGESTEVLLNPPTRSSSTRSSPTFGLPASPRKGNGRSLEREGQSPV